MLQRLSHTLALIAASLMLAACNTQFSAQQPVFQPTEEKAAEADNSAKEVASDSELLDSVANKLLSESGDLGQCAIDGGVSNPAKHLKLSGSAFMKILSFNPTAPGSTLVLLRPLQQALRAGKTIISASGKDRDCEVVADSTLDLVYGTFEAAGLYWKFIGGNIYNSGKPMLEKILAGEDVSEVIQTQMDKDSERMGPEAEAIGDVLMESLEVIFNFSGDQSSEEKIDDILLKIQNLEDELKAKEGNDEYLS